MKLSRSATFAGLALIAVVLSQQGYAKGKVYTWTDSKGTVHFGERPPADVKATIVKTRSGHSDPTPAQVAAAQPKASIPASAAPEVQQPSSLKDPARCTAAKENLAILNTVARIKTTNAEGAMVILTEEDKVQQRIVAQKVIDQACE